MLCVSIRYPWSSGGGVFRSGGARGGVLSGVVGVFLEVGVGVFRYDG